MSPLGKCLTLYAKHRHHYYYYENQILLTNHAKFQSIDLTVPRCSETMQLQFTKVLQLSLAIPPRLDAMSVSKSRYANRHNVMSG